MKNKILLQIAFVLVSISALMLNISMMMKYPDYRTFNIVMVLLHFTMIYYVAYKSIEADFKDL